MSLYLNARILVALFVIDPSSSRAEAFLSAHPEIVVVSDFGVAEFSSAVGRRVRTGDLTREDGQLAFCNFDNGSHDLHTGRRSRLPISTQQLGFLRRLDINLRTADAIHIAISRRLGAALVTFDRSMAAGARALGVAVATP